MSGEEHSQHLRLLEALLFASSEPLDESSLAARLPGDVEVRPLLDELREHYANRGVVLERVGGRWAFRTAPDLADQLKVETEVQRKLSKAAIETLSIIAYHQPVTRAEIEEIRGVSQSKGTFDVLLEAGWIKPGRRRRTPGKPLTWLTTERFLDHFGLETLDELPGVEELKAAGLLDARPAIDAFRQNQPDLLDEVEEDGDDEEGSAQVEVDRSYFEEAGADDERES